MATLHSNMRIWHRYLGFFLAGIMAVYACSGIVLIFRDTEFLKKEKQVHRVLAPNLTADQLGKELRMRELKFIAENADSAVFKDGVYHKASGAADYTIKTLPAFVEKLTHLHKASSKEPLFFLNVFFAVSLLFFVVSSFWMFLPKTTIFRKGLYFTLAGLVLTLLLLFL